MVVVAVDTIGAPRPTTGRATAPRLVAMKRLILTGGVCAALAAAVLAGGATAQTAPPTLELHQLERDSRSGFVDNPPRRRESRGDVFTVGGRVRDASGRSVGSAHAVFTQTGRRTAHGGGTFTLSDGAIVVSGRLGGSGTDTLAIVGGTGAYAGATGTVLITESRGRTAFRFTLG